MISINCFRCELDFTCISVPRKKLILVNIDKMKPPFLSKELFNKEAERFVSTEKLAETCLVIIFKFLHSVAVKVMWVSFPPCNCDQKTG